MSNYVILIIELFLSKILFILYYDPRNAINFAWRNSSVINTQSLNFNRLLP